MMMLLLSIGCRSRLNELNIDRLNVEREAVSYSGETRLTSVNLFEALEEIERRTDLIFVVSPNVLRAHQDLDRTKFKQTFRFKTDEEAVNALQFAFSLNAVIRDRIVYLDAKESEIIDHPITIELCFLAANTAKSIDAAANLQFLDESILDAKINELISIKLDAHASAANGWQVSKRSVTLMNEQTASLSNVIINYVERSNLSDYGVRSVNGYDEREGGDILDLELVASRSRSAFVKFRIEESKFSSSMEKTAVKIESVQAIDSHWRIVADYYRAERESTLKLFGQALSNRKTRFIVLARLAERALVDDNFLAESN